MAESAGPNEEQLRRQVTQHLASLRAAGVEWLPKGKMRIEEGGSKIEEAHALPPSSIVGSGQGRREEAEAQALFSDFAGLEPPREEGQAKRPPNLAENPPLYLPPASGGDTEGGLTLEQRRQGLRVLTEKVCQCTRCPELVSARTQTVFGVGPAGAELCFVGEAPGADEDAQGEPFVGAAGQLLNRIIAACKMKREEVYICNIIKCRPPGNRTPLPHEAANCREHLERQLELLQPKFICALGATAAKFLLNSNQSIGQLRRRFHDYRGIPVICTYHPAYLLPHRSPDKKKDVWEDMKMLLAKMGRPVE